MICVHSAAYLFLHNVRSSCPRAAAGSSEHRSTWYSTLPHTGLRIHTLISLSTVPLVRYGYRWSHTTRTVVSSQYCTNYPLHRLYSPDRFSFYDLPTACCSLAQRARLLYSSSCVSQTYNLSSHDRAHSTETGTAETPRTTPPQGS